MDDDELSRALGKAAQGAVIGPIGGPGNYVVIKVTAREEQGHYEFREVSGNVRNAVVSKKSLELIDGLVKKLRSRASIEVDEEAIASLRVSGTRDESQDTDSGTHVEAH